jgi:cobalt-zinc-cadmium efflux system membrane fusion protein
VHIGQAIYFAVLAYPDEAFPANISYVAASFDSTSRRLLVRATVNNSAGLFKPEMFANVTILRRFGLANLPLCR